MKKKGPSVISFPVRFCLLVRKMMILMVACFEWLSGSPAVECRSEFEPHFLCSPVSLVHLDGKKSLELLKYSMSSEQFWASNFPLDWLLPRCGMTRLKLAEHLILEAVVEWWFYHGVGTFWEEWRQISSYLQQTLQGEWTKWLVYLGESRAPSAGACQWLTQMPACTKGTCTHTDWSENGAYPWWLRWKCFWEGVELR